MALSDPTQSRTTAYDSASYTAGKEPWNKNLDLYNIPSKATEGTTYQVDWEKWHGMYREIPELRSTIDTESRWIISEELILGDDKTKEAAKRIKGTGKQNIRTILLNLKRTAKICGLAFAWAPRDKAGRLINLKILDPGSIEIQADKMGIIQKYVQVAEKGTESKIDARDERVILEEWDPKEIFHINNDAIADEIHGIPEPEKMQRIIKMRHQAMGDQAVILHRYGKPTFFYEANTDDETELVAIKNKIDKAQKDFESVVMVKGSLEKIDRIAVPQFSTLDPLPYMKFLRSYFTESSGVPELVRGKSDEVSLAAGKLNFVSYKQGIIFQQVSYSEEIKDQLGLDIKFKEPIEIDLEIARTPEDMAMKESAKRGAGGDLQTTNKLPGTGDKK